MVMEEEWRDIKGYEKMYQISNFGRVKRLKGFGCKKERILKPGKNKFGYLVVALCNNGRIIVVYIHRLVAEAFIPNPNNYNEINHINEDKTDNMVSNLEWCTHIYNTNFGTRNERISDSKKRTVNQYTLSGEFVKEWVSLSDASKELSIYISNICLCCQGKLKSTGGFKWYYVNDPVQYIDRPLW